MEEYPMTKPTVVMAAMFTLALTGALGAQDKPKIVMKPPPASDPNDGGTMFRDYCASCHGPEGRGNGPAAAALKTTPADLTGISARNGGKFPVTKVRRYIQGLDEMPAHGSREMPVWGQVLRGLPGGDAAVQLRVEGLLRYVESIQRK
jgi:mono/diheme cytochrome c family protein